VLLFSKLLPSFGKKFFAIFKHLLNKTPNLTMHPHPDNSYIEALLKNDKKEIEKIYEEYSQIVTSFVVNNSGSVEEAKDLFQDTIIDLYQMGLKGFELT